MNTPPPIPFPSTVSAKRVLACALAFSAFAGTLFGKDVFVEGVSTESGWFDVSKRVLSQTPAYDDSNMCGFATSANMLAYWQSRHPTAFPSSMPKGVEAIYNDMFRIYGNTSANPNAILGAMTDNQTSCYLDRIYGEARNFAVAPGLGNPHNFDDLYVGRTGVEFSEDSGLKKFMEFPDVLAWALEHNSPLGFNLQIAHDSGSGAHALTVWGAKYNDYDGGLLGLYYTNSDDTDDAGMPFVGLKYSGDGNIYKNGEKWTWKREDNRAWAIFDVTALNPDALFVVAVPEPSASALLAGTLAAAFCAARRRRRNGA